MSRHLCVLPISAESRHAPDNEAWIQLQQNGRGAETELFEDAGPEWVDDYIDAGYQGLYEGDARGGLEVNGYAALAASEDVGCGRGRVWAVGGGMRAVDAEDGGAVVG